MSSPVRKILFFVFCLIFFISAPLIVLYTAGYRINLTNRVVSQTAALALASTPKGAMISINGTRTKEKTPTVFQRLSSGTITVRFEKEGYHSWERTIFLESGKTSYITAPLFLDTNATPLLAGSRAFNLAQAARTDSEISATDIFLVDNGKNVEISVVTIVGTTLIGLLPQETYTIIARTATDIVLLDQSQKPYMLSLTANSEPVALSMTAVAWAWLEEDRLFVWSDGNEIRLYNATTRETNFITRQGDTITHLAFAQDGYGILAATAHTVVAWDRYVYENGRFSTTIIDNHTIDDFWCNETGDRCYFATKQEGGEEIWEYELVK